jgi:hypothetical protein
LVAVLAFDELSAEILYTGGEESWIWIEGLGGNTYVIPRHCLLPLENETMYFSSALPSSPSQRSGMNSYEFGKMVSL